MTKLRAGLKLSLCLGASLLLSSCTLPQQQSNKVNEDVGADAVSENNISYEQRQAKIRTSAYELPFETSYDKLTHILNDKDSICVVTAIDYNNGEKLYKNSGKFVTEELYRNFAQYNLRTRLISRSDNVSLVQGQARKLGCNMITIPRIENFLVDTQKRRDMRVSIQMFDSKSLNLLNSIAINAPSQDTLKEGITYLVHKLYFPKK